MTAYGMGWRRQALDARDEVYRYAAPAPVLAALPPAADLRKTGLLPPVYDQLQLGSCVGNAVNANVQFLRARQKLADAKRVPSRLMTYYLAREREGTVETDAGCEIRDGIKAVVQTGVCFEDGPDGWPYAPARFRERPPARCFEVAARNQALEYKPVSQILNQLRGCLAEGFPFVFGFTVYPSFSATVESNGRVALPRAGEAPEGGHAVMAVGYNDADGDGVFLIRNSWSDRWARSFRGHFMMPYAFLTDPHLASDFWTIRTVEA